MSLLAMEICHCGRQYIGHGALSIHQLDIALLVDSLVHRYGAVYIQSHAAPYYWDMRFYALLSNVHPASYFQWLQLQRCRECTAVCVAVVSLPVAHSMMGLSFGSIRIQSPRPEVFFEPRPAALDKVRKMITKSAKS